MSKIHDILFNHIRYISQVFLLEYILVTDYHSFHGAQDHCISINRTLMEPKTQQALDDTFELRRQDSNYFWLGGSDEVTEGTWLWLSDGSPIDLTQFWAEDRPNRIGFHQDYLCVSYWEPPKLLDCADASLPFICEAP